MFSDEKSPSSNLESGPPSSQTNQKIKVLKKIKSPEESFSTEKEKIPDQINNNNNIRRSPDGLDELFSADISENTNTNNPTQEDLFDDTTESNFIPDKASTAKVIPKIIPKVLKRCPVKTKQQEETEKELKARREQERLENEKSMAQKEQDYRKVREKYFGLEDQVSFDQESPNKEGVTEIINNVMTSSQNENITEVVYNNINTISHDSKSGPTLDQAISTKPRQQKQPNYTTDKRNTYPFYKNQHSYDTINQQKSREKQMQNVNNEFGNNLATDFETLNLLNQQQMIINQQEQLKHQQAQISQQLMNQSNISNNMGGSFRGRNSNNDFKPDDNDTLDTSAQGQILREPKLDNPNPRYKGHNFDPDFKSKKYAEKMGGSTTGSNSSFTPRSQNINNSNMNVNGGYKPRQNNNNNGFVRHQTNSNQVQNPKLQAPNLTNPNPKYLGNNYNPNFRKRVPNPNNFNHNNNRNFNNNNNFRPRGHNPNNHRAHNPNTRFNNNNNNNTGYQPRFTQNNGYNQQNNNFHGRNNNNLPMFNNHHHQAQNMGNPNDFSNVSDYGVLAQPMM